MKLYGRAVVLVALAVTMSLLVGCSRHDNNERYILVTVNSKLPYWQTAAAGLAKAGALYGVKVDVRGPDTYDIQAEVKEFQDAVALKPAGILVSVPFMHSNLYVGAIAERFLGGADVSYLVSSIASIVIYHFLLRSRTGAAGAIPGAS